MASVFGLEWQPFYIWTNYKGVLKKDMIKVRRGYEKPNSEGEVWTDTLYAPEIREHKTMN